MRFARWQEEKSMEKLFRNVVQHLVAHAKRICTGEYNISNAILYRIPD